MDQRNESLPAEAHRHFLFLSNAESEESITRHGTAELTQLWCTGLTIEGSSSDPAFKYTDSACLSDDV
jgi:hypothetical protein